MNHGKILYRSVLIICKLSRPMSVSLKKIKNREKRLTCRLTIACLDVCGRSKQNVSLVSNLGMQLQMKQLEKVIRER